MQRYIITVSLIVLIMIHRLLGVDDGVDHWNYGTSSNIYTGITLKKKDYCCASLLPKGVNRSPKNIEKYRIKIRLNPNNIRVFWRVSQARIEVEVGKELSDEEFAIELNRRKNLFLGELAKADLAWPPKNEADLVLQYIGEAEIKVLNVVRGNSKAGQIVKIRWDFDSEVFCGPKIPQNVDGVMLFQHDGVIPEKGLLHPNIAKIDYLAQARKLSAPRK